MKKSIKFILVLLGLFFCSNNIYSASRPSTAKERLQKKRDTNAADSLEKNTQDFINEYIAGNKQKAFNIAKQKGVDPRKVFNLVFKSGWDKNLTPQFIKLFRETGLFVMVDNTFILKDVNDPLTLKALLDSGLRLDASKKYCSLVQRISYCFLNMSEPNIFVNTVDMIMHLLRHNVNPNLKVTDGYTSLTALAGISKNLFSYSEEAVVAVKTITKILLNAGANPRISNDAGDTIFSIGNPLVIETIREYYSRNKPSELKNFNETAQIFEQVKKRNEAVASFENQLKFKNLKIAKIVAQETGINGNETISNLTPLDLLVMHWDNSRNPENGNLYAQEILDIFRERGCDFNFKNAQGNTPLFYALPDAIYFLINMGANPNIASTNFDTPLLSIASKLNTPGIDNSMQIDKMVALLNCGAMPDLTNRDGQTIYQLQKGAALSSPIIWNALKRYYRMYYPDGLKAIEEMIQPWQIKEIKHQIGNGNFELAKSLLEQTDLNGNEVIQSGQVNFEDDGITILESLVLNWNDYRPVYQEILDMLIKRGVDLNFSNPKYGTPLYNATPLATQALIDAGANHQLDQNDRGMSLLNTCAVLADHFKDLKMTNKMADKALVLLMAKEKITTGSPAIKAPNREVHEFIRNGGKFAQYVLALRNVRAITDEARKRIDIDDID